MNRRKSLAFRRLLGQLADLFQASQNSALRFTLCIPFVLGLCLSTTFLSGQDPRPHKESDWETILGRAPRLFAAGKPAEATVAARQVLELTESLGADEERVAKALLKLSTILILQGDNGEAEKHSKRARRTLLSQLEKARLRVATRLEYLGAIHAQQYKLDEAAEFYLQAISLPEESVGPDHPETTKQVGNLRSRHLHRGKTEPAGRATAVSCLLRRGQHHHGRHRVDQPDPASG